jgi:hypothetical protein
MSNNRHRHPWTPADVHGRCEAGQTEYEWWQATSRVGFGTKRPQVEAGHEILSVLPGEANLLDEEVTDRLGRRRSSL